mmetsp:Transcript_52780/g.150440  ORF Transcript_52780/g.150440 Transcript_52780/m.150440 type:complete len:82 (-) Transcript_52780:421-666(-)
MAVMHWMVADLTSFLISAIWSSSDSSVGKGGSGARTEPASSEHYDLELQVFGPDHAVDVDLHGQPDHHLRDDLVCQMGVLA